MKVQEDNQTSLTDELYENSLALSKLHDKLGAIERRTHYVRSKVVSSQLKVLPKHWKLYNALDDEIKHLTSVMDWLSDAMFYIGNESEDVETRTKESYKVLTNRNNPVDIDGYIDMKPIEKEVLQIRIDLFRLLSRYWDAINNTIPCMSIYEHLIEEARAAVKKFKKINYYNHV